MLHVKKIKGTKSSETMKEIMVMIQLDHKFIIKIQGFHTEDEGQTICIVMEYANRGTFSSLTTKASLLIVTLHWRLGRDGGSEGSPLFELQAAAVWSLHQEV